MMFMGFECSGPKVKYSMSASIIVVASSVRRGTLASGDDVPSSGPAYQASKAC